MPLRRESFEQAALIILIGLFAVPLLIYGYIGTFARYTADDYCFITADLSLDYQRYLYEQVQGRLAANLAISSMRWVDPRDTPALTLILLIGMVAATFAALYALTKRIGMRHAALAALLLAEVCVVAMLQTSYKGHATIGQVWYWRTGALTYAPAKILIGVSLALIGMGFGRWRGVWIALAGVIAFIGGSFSETYAALMLGLCAALIAMLWLIGDRRGVPLLIATMIGSAAAMAVIAASGGTTIRASHFPEPPSVIGLIAGSILTTIWYVGEFVRASPAAVLMLATLPPTIMRWLRQPSITVPQAGQGSALPLRDDRTRLIITIGLPAAILIAVVFSVVPSLYATSGIAPRTLTVPATLMVIGMAAWGMLVTPSIRFDFERDPALRRISEGAKVAVVVAAMIGVLAWEIKEAPERIAEAQAYADAWDVRDSMLRTAVSEGRLSVSAPVIASGWGLGDLSGSATNWINKCAADAYGLREIRAK